VAMLLALISGLSDYISRVLVDNPNNLYYALCNIPSLLPVYFIGVAYRLSLYNWVSVYSTNVATTFKIAFIVYAGIDLLVFVASTTCACEGRKLIENSNLALISNLLFLFAALCGGVVLSTGFVIYGYRITVKLKKGKTLRLFQRDDEYVYKVTVRCILMSATMLAGSVGSIIGYILYYYNQIDITIIDLVMGAFVAVSLGVLIYTTKPKKGKTKAN